jgi:endonuclease/exonuclease/phosphatase family metal-dependent hydrolase
MRSEGREWGVMTWNIHGAAGPDLDELANVVRAEGPDVLALQEAQRAQAVELAQRLGMRFTWARKHWAKTPLLWRRAEGLAIMTPHALDAAGHTEISDGVTSWSYRRRIAQWALVGRPDRSAYRVYNLHLSPNEMSVERRAEAVRVAEIVAEHGDSPPAIVTGDFNDGADGSVIYALPGIEYEVPPPTSPAITPTEVLDHVLLPDDASHVATSVPGGGPEWAARSDHLPVSARFTIDWVIDDFA